MTSKKKKDVKWNFKATEEFVRRLNRAAELLDRPASQIAREAIGEKLDEIAEKFPEIDQVKTQRKQTVAA